MRTFFRDILCIIYCLYFHLHGQYQSKIIKKIIKFRSLFRTEDFGSECEVFAATSDTLNGRTGVFMSDMKEVNSSEESYNVEKAKRLWDLSEQWTRK
jgi:hypothetical protein